MVDLRVTTTTDQDAVLNEQAVEQFRASLRGEVFCSRDDGAPINRLICQPRDPSLIQVAQRYDYSEGHVSS